MVMKELKACINENVPKSGNIYPFADGWVNGLLYTVLVCGVVHWDAVLQCGDCTERTCIRQTPAALRVGGHPGGS